MLQSEKIDQIIPAMFKAQNQMGVAKKDADNPFYKSKYSDLATIQGVIEKPLFDNELVVVQGAGLSVNGPFIFTTVYHAPSSQWLRSEFAMILAKQDPQGVGSATTYLRRYGLCAMFNIEQADDDGNAAALDPKQNGQKSEAVSMQKAGTERANQIKEYHEANLLKDKEIKDALTKHKAASVKELPKNVADDLINLALDRETVLNDNLSAGKKGGQ